MKCVDPVRMSPEQKAREIVATHTLTWAWCDPQVKCVGAPISVAHLEAAIAQALKDAVVWPSQTEMFEAFKQSHQDYPSQDNEGYLPDRAGFKCGWFEAIRWLKARVERGNK